jgi:hypothetical protein
MGWETVPTTCSVADVLNPTSSSVPALNLTMTPGLIVNVAPFPTLTVDVTTYGLPERPQVVLVLIAPPTFVGILNATFCVTFVPGEIDREIVCES